MKGKFTRNSVILIVGSLSLAAVVIFGGTYLYLDRQKTSGSSQTSAYEREGGVQRQAQATIAPTSAPTPTSEPAVVGAAEEVQEPENAIHRYEYIIADCTWEQAWQDCINRGGYLVRIDSPEEFEHIITEITANGYDKKVFFLGGRRETTSSEYYWVDDKNVITGSPLNSPDCSIYNYWMMGEPSYQDGNIPENCLMTFFYESESRWVINDSPNEVLAFVPDYQGKIGYICEYEQ